jgi:YD repeat-containing protein
VLNVALVLSLLLAPSSGVKELGQQSGRLAGTVLTVVSGSLGDLLGSLAAAQPVMAAPAAAPAARPLAAPTTPGSAYTWNGNLLSAWKVTTGGVPIDDAIAVSTGGFRTLIVRSDRTVWEGDKFGNGVVQKTELSDVIAVSAGDPNGLALKSDGTVWAWGSGWGYTATPQQVTGFGGPVVAISNEFHKNAALTQGGAVYFWGDSFNAGLPVPDLTSGATAIGVAQQSLQATRSDGVVIGRGSYYGPNNVVVSGITNASSLDGGTAWAFGGVLGGGAYTWPKNTSPTATIVPNLTSGVLEVKGSNAYTVNDRIVLKQDGTVWTWKGDPPPPTLSQVTWQGLASGQALTISMGTAVSLAIVVDPLAVVPDESTPTEMQSDALLHSSTSRDPVVTGTGAYSYNRTDLAIPGRGPSPAFVRSYNSADTRIGPLGQGWTHNYNIRLRRPSSSSFDLFLVRADGRSDRYTRNADGTYTAPAGVYATLVRNPDGTYTATHPDQTVWIFSNSGRLTVVKDRHGNQSDLSYNASGQLTAVSDPAGRGSLTLGYHPSGRLASVTDWASPARVVQFGYDASNRLNSATDRENKVTTYGYDGTSHRLATITDARSNVAVTNTYDAQGRVQTQKDARGLITGQQTSFGYVTNGDGTKTTTVTYPLTSFEPAWSPTEADTYDTLGRITKRVSKPTSSAADDVTVEYTYDAGSNLASVKDGRGNTANLCYDVDEAGATIPGSKGNLTRRIDPPPTGGANRPVTLFKYDSKNNLTRLVPPKGIGSGPTVTCTTNLSASLSLVYASDLAYDAGQTKLLSVTRQYTDPELGQLSAVTKFEYNDSANPGLLTKLIPPRGNTGGSPDYTYATSFAYFGSGSREGMLESLTDPLANKTTYDYDSVGRTLSTVDPNGNAAGGVPSQHTWELSYDKEDRVRFAKAPPPSAGGAQLVTEFRYDSVGNREVVIDANGQVTKYLFDERDALKEVHQSPSPGAIPL